MKATGQAALEIRLGPEYVLGQVVIEFDPIQICRSMCYAAFISETGLARSILNVTDFRNVVLRLYPLSMILYQVSYQYRNRY